jgi:P27 family predicted phage terminase small subunit
MRGRKPTPTALRLLRGNPRKRPINAAEPKPSPLPAGLAAPTWLDPDAAAEWNRVAPMLGRLGVLTETDADALAAYCEAFTTWKQATQRLRQFGMVVKRTKAGLELPVISPYVKIAHHAMAQMRAFLVEFGMTPSSRARIHTAAPAETPISKWGGKL